MTHSSVVRLFWCLGSPFCSANPGVVRYTLRGGFVRQKASTRVAEGCSRQAGQTTHVRRLGKPVAPKWEMSVG